MICEGEREKKSIRTENRERIIEKYFSRIFSI